MLRHLQIRADDLAECLLIFELELRRSRSLAKRLEAYEDFERVVDRIDALRRDAETLHADQKDEMLDRLDRKAVSVGRSPPYRIAEWLTTAGGKRRWLVLPGGVEPMGK